MIDYIAIEKCKNDVTDCRFNKAPQNKHDADPSCASLIAVSLRENETFMRQNKNRNDENINVWYDPIKGFPLPRLTVAVQDPFTARE
jgi:hypothetical protein